MNDISKSVITDGIVIGQKKWENKAFPDDSEFAPMISFYYSEELITFTAPRSIKLESGSKVKVIYRKGNPYRAQLFNFYGYWLNAVILTLLPIIIVSALVFTFVGKSDKVLFSFGKVKLIKHLNDVESVEYKKELM
ncbi:MAG: hypothetical protein JXR36_03410 [Bacteroidales bacterium]|nr:hypothetical protein [Bacteroidales bacterium]